MYDCFQAGYREASENFFLRTKFLEGFDYGLFGHHAIEGVLYLTVPNDKDGGYFVDSKPPGNQILVGIDLAYCGTAVKVFGHFLEYRFQHSARKAPLSVEVYEDGAFLGGFHDVLLKVFVSEAMDVRDILWFGSFLLLINRPQYYESPDEKESYGCDDDCSRFIHGASAIDYIYYLIYSNQDAMKTFISFFSHEIDGVHIHDDLKSMTFQVPFRDEQFDQRSHRTSGGGFENQLPAVSSYHLFSRRWSRSHNHKVF